MVTKKRQFGNFGEKIAEKFLIKNGYRILTKNFYTKFGEIDIVCSKVENDINELFFVEVKTRIDGGIYNYPENAVNFNKIYKMNKAAQIYLNKNNLTNIFYSFSCVAIILNKKEKNIKIKFFKRI